MKKQLILLGLLMLAVPLWAGDDISVVGTIWNQENNKAVLAPDITGGVDLSNASNVVLPNFSTTGPATITGGMDINLSGSDNITIDGSTDTRDVTIGAIRQEHTAGIAGTRAYHIALDPNGQDDTNGIVIRTDLNGSTNTIRTKGINFNADIVDAQNVHMNYLEFAKIGDKHASVKVDAIDVRHGVSVIHHHSGTTGPADISFKYDDSLTTFTNVTAAFNSSAIDVTIFDEVDDMIYIGHADPFSTVAIILDTVTLNPGVKPTFEYSQGSSTWAVLDISDDTNGFRENGNVFYSEPDDWATDTVNSVASKYWVRIKRIANNVSPIPIEDIIEISADITYEWDEYGDLAINDVRLRNLSTTGTVTLSNYSGLLGIDGNGNAFSAEAGGGGTVAYGFVNRTTLYDLGGINTWYDIPLDGLNGELTNITHSTSSNPERVYVDVAGTYYISPGVFIRRQSADHHMATRLFKNGATEISGSYSMSAIYTAADNTLLINKSVIASLAANDYITIQATTNGNVTNEIDMYDGANLADTTSVRPFASIAIHRLGD